MRAGALAGALLLCGLFAGAGLGYVAQRNRNEAFGRQLQHKQARLQELRMQDQYLERQLADLRSHRMLEKRVQDLNLGLVMPEPRQILRLWEPPAANGHEPGLPPGLAATRPPP